MWLKIILLKVKRYFIKSKKVFSLFPISLSISKISYFSPNVLNISELDVSELHINVFDLFYNVSMLVFNVFNLCYNVSEILFNFLWKI